MASSSSAFSQAVGLRESVYALIYGRLASQNGCSIPANPESINLLLPPTPSNYINDAISTSEQEKLWSQVSLKSLLVSDDELQSIFSLSIATVTSPKPPKDVHTVYIRSFCIKTTQLEVILSIMQARGLISAEEKQQRISDWHSMLSLDQEMIWIRYIGQTKTPFTPWKRHWQDINRGDRSFAVSFIQMVQEKFPEVIKAATIFTFQTTTTSQEIADLHEQAAIALLNPSLLNLQWGGTGIGYAVTPDEITFFKEFKTSLLENLPTGPSSTDTSAAEYVQKLRGYYTENIETNQKKKKSFTDLLYSTSLEQLSVPSVSSSDCSLAIIMGSDPTSEVFRSPERFLSGPGKTSKLMAHFLTSMAAAEGSSSSSKNSSAALQSSPSISDALAQFQFTNLFPWPGKDVTDLRSVTQIHASYLKQTQPLLILSLSDRVSVVAWNGFDDDFVAGYKFYSGRFFFDGEQFQSVVGRPSVTQLDGTEQYFICIPSYHPRMMAKVSSAGQQAYGRVMFRILTVFWLTASTILELSRNSRPSATFEFCSKVVDLVEERLKIADFHTRFAEEREQLSKYLLNQAKARTDGRAARAREAEGRMEGPVALDVSPTDDILPDTFYTGPRRWLVPSNRPVDIEKSLDNRQYDDENSADPMWFFSMFFADLFGCHGLPDENQIINFGNRSLSAQGTIFAKLHDFCRSSRYLKHPFIRQIQELCTFEEVMGGKQQVSSVTMTSIAKKLFPQAAPFREYLQDNGVNTTKVKSMMLIPSKGSSFAGFLPGDLTANKIWKADKRKRFMETERARKKAKRGSNT
jgi:hypothetical protein